MHIAFRSTAGKSIACLPVASVSEICEQFAALANTGTGRCTEWDHGFATEVIGFDESIHRPCCDSPPDRIACICQDWDKKNFIFFCTYSIKPLLIFKVQNSLLLLTFSLLPIEEASSFFTTGFLYYSFCLLHCISDKVLTLKHNFYIFVVVNEHLINYV